MSRTTRPRTNLAPFVLILTVIMLLTSVTPAFAQGRPLFAPLSGGSDPAKGDVDGSGFVWLELNQGQGRICLEAEISGTSQVMSIRIVEAESGRVRVALNSGVGLAAGCVEVDKDLVKQIRQEYEEYSVVVATSQYPNGALRGTLRNPTSEENGLRDGRALPVIRPRGWNGPVGEQLDRGRGNDDRDEGDDDDGNRGNSSNNGRGGDDDDD